MKYLKQIRQLGQQLTALPYFKYVKGMLYHQDDFSSIIVRVHGHSIVVLDELDEVLCFEPADNDWVNMRHPGTRGCVLQQIRTLANDDETYAMNFEGCDGINWAVVSPLRILGTGPWHTCLLGIGDTEAEALVNAMINLGKKQ